MGYDGGVLSCEICYEAVAFFQFLAGFEGLVHDDVRIGVAKDELSFFTDGDVLEDMVADGEGVGWLWGDDAMVDFLYGDGDTI